MKRTRILHLLVLILFSLSSACSLLPGDAETLGNTGDYACPNRGYTQVHIVSGSENNILQDMIQQWGCDNRIDVEMTYLGSVDISQQLEAGTSFAYDAVWPANRMWIQLGDSQDVVKHIASIMRSPVVFAATKGVVRQLGWVGKDVRMQDILDAADSGALHMGMTSATQSNSGATSYMEMLYAFAGAPEVLTHEDLANPDVGAKVKKFLSLLDRSSGSSGWLKDLFVSGYPSLNAMWNYEALMIEANQELMAEGYSGDDLLYVIYPVDGLGIADSPLGYVDKGEADKEEAFLKLQEWLLSADTQARIQGFGRRTGVLGINIQDPDTSVFNPDWGIDTTRVLVPINVPEREVIREALNLYQETFRKRSVTVFCLDYSGSMYGDGEADLERSLYTILNQDSAKQYLLQATPDDVTYVVAFNDQVIGAWYVEGNNPADFNAMLAQATSLEADGGTDMYLAVDYALRVILEPMDLSDALPAIIVMTDGQSQGNRNVAAQAIQETGLRVPIFGITYGDVEKDQLEWLTEQTAGRVFDGSTNLLEAIKSAKGYN